MTPDQKLEAFFAIETPPSRDLVFMAAVAQRIARRRAVFSVLAGLPWAGVAAIILWALRPTVEAVGAGMGELEPSFGLVGLSAVVVAAAFGLVRRLSRI